MAHQLFNFRGGRLTVPDQDACLVRCSTFLRLYCTGSCRYRPYGILMTTLDTAEGPSSGRVLQGGRPDSRPASENRSCLPVTTTVQIRSRAAGLDQARHTLSAAGKSPAA